MGSAACPATRAARKTPRWRAHGHPDATETDELAFNSHEEAGNYTNPAMSNSGEWLGALTMKNPSRVCKGSSEAHPSRIKRNSTDAPGMSCDNFLYGFKDQAGQHRCPRDEL